MIWVVIMLAAIGASEVRKRRRARRAARRLGLFGVTQGRHLLDAGTRQELEVQFDRGLARARISLTRSKRDAALAQAEINLARYYDAINNGASFGFAHIIEDD